MCVFALCVCVFGLLETVQAQPSKYLRRRQRWRRPARHNTPHTLTCTLLIVYTDMEQNTQTLCVRDPLGADIVAQRTSTVIARVCVFNKKKTSMNSSNAVRSGFGVFDANRL